MKQRFLRGWPHLFAQINRAFFRRRLGRVSSHHGFTLTEFLVGSLITSVVILVAWSGLIAVMDMSRAAEARTARQTELYKALDFMTAELRLARSINATEDLQADGLSVSVADVVTSSGLDLSRLGDYGTIALYVERPTSEMIPAICPVGGPNAGAAPLEPADYDRVVYDIRPSPSAWLSPRILMRYGRVPAADGTVNPCSIPISSDPMADALSATAAKPACTGVVSGEGGFHACVDGQQANLYFQSDVTKTETKSVGSSVASRLSTVNLPTEISLTLKPDKDDPGLFEIKSSWPKAKKPKFKLYESVNGVEKQVAQGGKSIKYTIPNDGVRRCYRVEGQGAKNKKAGSNQVCTDEQL
jgi:hypothetical protein